MGRSRVSTHTSSSYVHTDYTSILEQCVRQVAHNEGNHIRLCNFSPNTFLVHHKFNIMQSSANEIPMIYHALLSNQWLPTSLPDLLTHWPLLTIISNSFKPRGSVQGWHIIVYNRRLHLYVAAMCALVASHYPGAICYAALPSVTSSLEYVLLRCTMFRLQHTPEDL